MYINISILTKFHVPRPTGLTVVAINAEAKQTYRLPCCFKFSTSISTNFHISRRYITTQFRTATVLVLLVVEN
jgi:hypothetical protein